jgi:hypothetical protein
MRRLAIVVVVVVGVAVSVRSAAADPPWASRIWDDLARQGDWDDGRIGIGPVLGVGIGDGEARPRSRGVRAIGFVSRTIAVIGELRWFAGGARSRAGSVELGYGAITGKMFGWSDVRFDVLVSGGVGADDAQAGGVLGVGLRARLCDRLELEVGLHDDVYAAPGVGAVEARVAMTILWPPRATLHCFDWDLVPPPHSSSRLPDQPAI